MKKNTKVKKNVRGANTYTCCIREEHGFYPIIIRGINVICLLATVPSRAGGSPNQNPKNPRIEGKLKGKSQKEIGKLLQAANGVILRNALERNEGQIEPLIIFNNVIIEGNRRLHQFSQMDSTPEILVIVLPDNLDQDLVHALERTIHVSGKEEWESSVKSKLAYDLFMQTKDWKLVAAELQFKNVSAAKKYVNAHIWHREAAKLTLARGNPKINIDDSDHWSKFHHAVNPTLSKFFGYDAETETFSETANFKWFCQLIKNGKLTDCRHSDGIVRPVVALANNDEDDDTYLAFKKAIEKDGCESAWSKWRQMKKKNQVSTALAELTATVEHLNKAKARWGKLKGNKLVQGKILETVAVLEELYGKISDDNQAA